MPLVVDQNPNIVQKSSQKFGLYNTRGIDPSYTQRAGAPNILKPLHKNVLRLGMCHTSHTRVELLEGMSD